MFQGQVSQCATQIWAKLSPRHVALDSTSRGQEACRGDKMLQGPHTPSCFLLVVQHVPAVESE